MQTNFVIPGQKDSADYHIQLTSITTFYTGILANQKLCFFQSDKILAKKAKNVLENDWRIWTEGTFDEEIKKKIAKRRK